MLGEGLDKLSGNWNGRLFGTNTGNLSARIAVGENETRAEVRLLDDVFGPVVYDLVGGWDGSALALKGGGKAANPDVSTGEITLEGSLARDGHLLGRWTSTLGTGGTFQLFIGPSDEEAAIAADNQLPPEELHIAQERVGAVRLYREDVVALCNMILSDLTADRLAVRFQNGPTQTTKWSNDFIETVSEEAIPFIRFSVNDSPVGSGARLVTVELGHLYNGLPCREKARFGWLANRS